MKGLLILALVIAIGLVSVVILGRSDTTPRWVKACSEIRSLSAAVRGFRLNSGRYPTSDEGLSALVHRPETEPPLRKWLQLLKDIPPDPWGREYRYRALPEEDKRGFEVASAGKDGKFETEDDISSVTIPQ